MAAATAPGARPRWAGLLVVVTLVASACGGTDTTSEGPRAARRTPTTSDTTPSADDSARADEPSATPASPATPSPRGRWVRGVDASHHQGDVDWRAVAGDRIEFAYLKASEGSGFTDPRFRGNARKAARAGLQVGGYHYFSTCSPGAAQAEHFLDVLAGSAARSLPPAIDLELLGNCAEPPPRPQLLREVRTFIALVERARGGRVVVYAFPDFEARYRFAPVLERRQWVRRIGTRPPARDWWIWQRDDAARIAGIAGPADLNLMRR